VESIDSVLQDDLLVLGGRQADKLGKELRQKPQNDGSDRANSFQWQIFSR
jgi:hypothetical protein